MQGCEYLFSITICTFTLLPLTRLEHVNTERLTLEYTTSTTTLPKRYISARVKFELIHAGVPAQSPVEIFRAESFGGANHPPPMREFCSSLCFASGWEVHSTHEGIFVRNGGHSLLEKGKYPEILWTGKGSSADDDPHHTQGNLQRKLMAGRSSLSSIRKSMDDKWEQKHRIRWNSKLGYPPRPKKRAEKVNAPAKRQKVRG